MAIEAHHLHLISPQLIRNGEIIQTTAQNANLYNTQMALCTTENLNHIYNSSTSIHGDPFAALMEMNNNAADSGLTCNNLFTQKKRVRELNNPSSSSLDKDLNSTLSSNFPFSFLGEDCFFQIQQQQLEIDRFITGHMEKVRNDLAETHERHKKRIFVAAEEQMIKRLKAKDEEIEKIEKLNLILEEKVRSLCIENQMWRNLAMSNEAAANALQRNLDQVLLEQAAGNDDEQLLCELAADADSCCDSSGGGNDEREKDSKRRSCCKSCGKEEVCVLLWPCRHLCLCSKCGSRLNTCPLCNANKTGSVHVNIS